MKTNPSAGSQTVSDARSMKGIRLDLEDEALSIGICICREFKRHGYPRKLVQLLPAVVLFFAIPRMSSSRMFFVDKVLAFDWMNLG